MEKYNYINGLKVYDMTYYNNLHECINNIWCSEKGYAITKIDILDDYDYIECHTNVDRIDEIECYIYFASESITVSDIIDFSEMINIDPFTIEINNYGLDGLGIYWKEKVIHP